MATTTYMRQVSGALTEARTVETSAGAGDAGKIPNLGAAGTLDRSITGGVTASAGSGDANKPVYLDSSGRIDVSMMPVGVEVESLSVTATETIPAGSYVNLYNSSGLKARLADNSNNRPAHAYANASISNAGTGTVHLEGSNTQLSSRTPGATQFLGTAGAATETAPTSAGAIVQVLGVATSATAANFEPEQPITLA